MIFTPVSAFDASLPDDLFADSKQTSVEKPTQVPAPPLTSPPEPSDVLLGEPSCNAVAEANELICVVNYLRNSSGTMNETSVQATITCPLADGRDPTLTSINNPKECGCEALVTPANFGNGSNPLCSCGWCAGEDGSLRGLRLNCSGTQELNLGFCDVVDVEAGLNTSAPVVPSNTTLTPTSFATSTTPAPTPIATSADATSSPTAVSTEVDERSLLWIPSAFYVTNDQNKMANDLSKAELQGLNDAYVWFVEEIIAEMSATVSVVNDTRNLLRLSWPKQRRRQRRLQIEFVKNSEVYLVQDAPSCPEGFATNLTCLLAYGRYRVFLEEEDDPTAVSDQYTNITQQAIDEGKLQESLITIDPDTPLTVESTAPALTPAIATGSCTFCENGEEPLAMDKMLPTGNDEESTFSCENVAALYSQQSASSCLNYGSNIHQDMPPPMNSVYEELTMNYQEFCLCPPKSATSVSLDETTASTTCGPLCPSSKTITDEKLDLLDPQSGLTCGELESVADYLSDLRMCSEVIRLSAICCSDTQQLTTPPTKPGSSIVTIFSSFLAYNFEGLNADLLMKGPELESMSHAYAVFVEGVVADLQSNATVAPTPAAVPIGNETRFLRMRNVLSQTKQRRRLEVTYDMSSAEVYQFNDSGCPNTVPASANCSIGYGRYNLFAIEEDNSKLSKVYTNATQEAIDRGDLDDTLEEEEPYSVLNVEQATDDLVPQDPTTTRTYDDGGYDEFFMIGLGVSIALIAFTIVTVLCASDFSGPQDDDSVDPWDKDGSRGSKRGGRRERPPEEKPQINPENKDLPPKTERQEYEMYRAQVEKLVEQKTPEEFENVDDLMDLFYEREMLLIATLEKMPDATEHAEEEEEYVDDDLKRNGNMSTNSMDMQSFADEDESSEESANISAVIEEGSDDEEVKQTAAVESALSLSTDTIEEADEEETETASRIEDQSAKVNLVDGSFDTDDDEEAEEAFSDEEESPLPPPRVGQDNCDGKVETPVESLDDSTKSGAEKWDDEETEH